MRSNTSKPGRLMSLLMAAVMVLAMLPLAGFAAAEDNETQTDTPELVTESAQLLVQTAIEPTVAPTDEPSFAPQQVGAKAMAITGFAEYPYSNPDDPDTHYIVVDKGTAENSIPLPATLKATIEGGETDVYTVDVSAWACIGTENEYGQFVSGGSYDKTAPGTYRFAPTLDLPESVTLADGVEPPTVDVVVTMGMGIMPLTSSGSTIDVSDSVTASGTGWTYDSGTNTFTVTGDVTITGTTTTNHITVASGAPTKNITLDGVSIDVSGTVGACAFDMTGATVNLTLAGGTTNTLKSGQNRAGLHVPSGTRLVIDGTGSLSATGGVGTLNSGAGAGIGGADRENGGNITINSGTVIAVGGYGSYSNGGAGIGGGGRNDGDSGGSNGTVTINGDSVTATGGSGAAGIGGGQGGSGGTVTISAGNVTATGGPGNGGAGIGGGRSGSGGNITITGGTVNATGTLGAAGIGGGYTGSGGSITINGGTVNAIGPVGIGGGMSGSGGTITINDGTVATNSYINGTVTNNGTLTVNGHSWGDPYAASDLTYTIPMSNAYNGSAQGISVTAPSSATVTLYYEGTGGTSYTKSTTAPTNLGTYAVTADVAGVADMGYAATTNLSLGNYTIVKASPTLALTVAPSAGQTYPNSVTLTVTLSGADDNEGKPITFTVNGTDYTATTVTGGVATYTVTNPGADTYTFSAAFAGDANNNAATSNTISGYSVAKGTPTYTVPTGLTATYGQTLANVTLPTGWAWDEAGTTAVGNAGTPTHSATFTPSDTANYNAVSGVSVSIAVSRANPSYSIPTGLTATYGDTLSSVAMPSGWAWSNPTAMVGNAGTHGFGATFTPTDTANYNTVNMPVPVTVNKANPTITTNPTAANVYKGAALSTSALTGGAASAPGAFAWANGTQILTTTGNFAVTFTPTDTTNYNTASANIAVTVLDKDALTALIGTAGGIKNAAVVGAGHGQYPQGAYDTFVAAITAAQNVADTAAALSSQATIDNAVTALQAESNAFNATKIAVNFIALDAAITDARAIAKGNYTNASYNALQVAITSAEVVRAKADVSQAEVDAAAQTIIDAKNALKSTYPVITHFGTYTGSGTAKARVDADHTKFIRLMYNGTEIHPSNYTITPGSTVITLNEAHLQIYPVGTHTFTAEYSDGTSEPITLTVNATTQPPTTPAITTPTGAQTPTTTLPRTGDDSASTGWWIAFALSVLGGICLFVGYRRRQAHSAK